MRQAGRAGAARRGVRRAGRARRARAAGRGRPRSACRCWSRPRSAAAGAACGSSATSASSPRRSPAPAGRRRRRSATARCSSSGYVDSPAARRGADLRRHARHGGAPVRAGVLDPAPLPEDHRGGAVAGGGRRAARRAGARPRSRRRKAIGYVGAGTVEFVLDASGRFFFLEVNTRLQVEHPVTELVTGLDLVSVQLRGRRGRAAGRRGHPGGHHRARDRGPAVRRGRRRRVPADQRRRCTRSRSRCRTGVRVDAGFAAGSRVSTYYDPMLAKVIGYGATRDDAAPAAGRGAGPGPAARGHHQPRPAGRDPARGRVRGGRHRHRLPGAAPLAELVPARRPPPAPAHPLAAALAGQAARRAAAPGAGQPAVRVPQHPERAAVGRATSAAASQSR